jgi:Carbamoyltransferase N-terminus
MEYFTYPHGLTMTGRAFERLLGGPARQPESKLTQREMDLACSVQEITEEVMLKMTAFAHRETGMRDLCLAGGVALNCVGNGRLLREGPFDQIWIQAALRPDLDSGRLQGRWRSPRRCARAVASPYGKAAPEFRNRGYLGTSGRSAGHSNNASLLRRHKRCVSGPEVQRRRDRRISHGQWVQGQAGIGRRAVHRGRWAAGAREGGKTAARTNGIRSAAARRPVHHRRRPFRPKCSR